MADDMMQEGKETPPVAFETPKGSNVPTLSGWLAGEHATASAGKPGVDLFSPAGSTSSRALRFSLSPELADDETESLRKQVRSLTEQLQRAKNEISNQASHQNGDKGTNRVSELRRPEARPRWVARTDGRAPTKPADREK